MLQAEVDTGPGSVVCVCVCVLAGLFRRRFLPDPPYVC